MDVSELEKISPESIKATSKKRKEIFDKIFDGVSTEIPPYKPITRTEITSTIETSEETPETEGLLPPPPPPPPAPSSTVPEGMYKTREEAERIDTSAYRPGLELLDKDDNLVGVVEGTSIQEHTDSSGITYYYPAVNIKKRDGSIVAIGLKALEGHKLKDPTVTALIPKYNVDDVFYDGDAKALRIKTVEVGDSISYVLSTEAGSEITVSEADLDRYSTTPPVLDVEEDEKDSLEDLGEHEDPETYEKRVRHENASNEKPKVTSDGRISHWLYTFNGYETGVLFDESGRIKPEYFTQKGDVTDDKVAKRSKVRIDNVNGLIKLGVVNTDTKKERCLEILADIHAILMSDTDNASVINRINEYTADNDIVHIEYGIKSSAGISSSDPKKVYGTGDSDEDWYVFDKHIDEKSEYAHKHVVKGDALNRTSVVAVFRNSKGKKVLEITLGSINSPITIGQRLNESGEYIYPEVGQRLEELDKLGRTPTGEEIYQACRECRDICLEKGYTDLYHLFKAFLFTSNGYAPISKPESNFNLAQKRKTGPNIIGQKGNYQKDDTRQYTPHYVNLSELQKDERIKVSRVWIPKSNTYGAKTYAHIKPGHAGVFVTYNPDYSEDDLAQIYLDNLEKGTPSDVEFYYVIPPDATTAEYLTNFRNGYLNAKDRSTKPTFAIGNMWTAYKLLRNIKNGGEFTQEKLKSKILDLIDFDVIKDYLQRLMVIESKTNWDGDSRYETLYEYYKRYYTNPKMAKQQAIRSIILEKQKDILMSKDSTTNLPIYKLFQYYLANAAYWNPTDTTPNPEVVKLIEKYNKGTIKYKILYQKDSGNDVGIFAPARTSDSNGFAIKTIDEFGNVVEKEFMINEKIDPPIFEFEELKEAITTLADYEYDERTRIKKLGDKLRGETEVYRRDTLPSRGAARPKNNFEKLKDSNKILFRTGGLFKDITVENTDDPDKSSEQFAIEILEKFNSTPNNLGFAIKDPSGKIKMYAFKIDELDSEIARPEMETLKSLGGITIGKALMFNTAGDTFEVTSDKRKYNIHVESNHIIFQPTELESRSTPTIKVSYNNAVLTSDIFNETLRIINESNNEALKASFGTFDLETANANPEYALSFYDMLEVLMSMDSTIKLPDQFVNFLAGASGSANVVVGDKVSLNEDFTDEVLTVDSVNGSLITLSNGSTVDVSSQNLFKKDKDTLIDCIQPIKIKYGK